MKCSAASLQRKHQKKYGVTAACVGGFHIDGISAEQIEEVVEAIKNFDI